eukprot:5923421-Amphidinium_carterae.1
MLPLESIGCQAGHMYELTLRPREDAAQDDSSGNRAQKGVPSRFRWEYWKEALGYEHGPQDCKPAVGAEHFGKPH